MSSRKKTVSKQKRDEIQEAVNSIPGLIIEHVSFNENSSMNDDDNNDIPHRKYIPSEERRRADTKKKGTLLFAVGFIILILATLWVVNVKTFFFDAKNSTSDEETLLTLIRKDFDSTIGTLNKEAEPTPTSTVSEDTLKSALSAIFTTSSTSTISNTSTVFVSSTTPTTPTSSSTTRSTSTP